MLGTNLYVCGTIHRNPISDHNPLDPIPDRKVFMEYTKLFKIRKTTAFN